MAFFSGSEMNHSTTSEYGGGNSHVSLLYSHLLCFVGSCLCFAVQTAGFTVRGRLSLVELTIRQGNGGLEICRCESMPTERQCRLLQALADNMSAGRQGTIIYVIYRGDLLTNICQGTFQFDVSAETESGDQIRQNAKMEVRGDDSPQSRKRKRARKLSLQPQRGSIEAFPVEHESIRLKVGDDKAVSAFFRRILGDAQQGLCKKLAKYWIKAINPHKQSNNPYTKGSERKPNWWPLTPPNNALGVPTKGTLENGFVRHKEPDHLSKSGKDLLHC